MLTITVTADPGAEIEKTFEESIALSIKLQCYVEFDFNGVTCISAPDGDKKIGVINYDREIQKKSGVKIATSY